MECKSMECKINNSVNKNKIYLITSKALILKFNQPTNYLQKITSFVLNLLPLY